ncbi:MAG: Alkaline phosphatase, partial [uncultured Rubrobacteraceae bacterium]
MKRNAVMGVFMGALLLLLASGVALAANQIECPNRDGGRCVGTDRPDLMRGTGENDEIYGRDGGDTLKGFGKFDRLFGQDGDDTLFGGLNGNNLSGGRGDDELHGGGAYDFYLFGRSDWGQDTIIDESVPRNAVDLPTNRGFTGTITTNMNPTPGPEVSNAQSGSTVEWEGNVIVQVSGSSGDDTVTGTEDDDNITDDAGAHTDTIVGAGGDDFLAVEDGY